MENTELNGYFHHFRGDYDAIPVDEVLDIRKYLMKKHDIK